MAKRPITDCMKEYRYLINSKMYNKPVVIQSVLFAQTFAEADRLFYWKVLTEFRPEDYNTLLTNATLDSCTECLIPTEEAPFANPGLLIFDVKLDGQSIRNFEKTRLAWKDENWHPGRKKVSIDGNKIATIILIWGAIFLIWLSQYVF